jgi:TetR/AcrR family transcriptional regulator, cholesterol catabolism regulator
VSRRDEILSAASRLFAEESYATTSMRDIGEACGVLAGSLYSHFKSKAEILSEITDRFFAELLPAQEAVIAGPGSGAARLRQMIRVVVGHCASHRLEMTIMHYDWPQIRRLPELAAVAAQSQRTLDLWHEVVELGQADGSIRENVDPELVARAITSGIVGLLDFRRFQDREHLLESTELEDLTAFLESAHLDGCATRRSSAAARPLRRGA